MPGIETEIRTIQLATRGEDVRDAIVGALLGIDARVNDTVDDELSATSENPVQNKVIFDALQGKQDALTVDSEPVDESDNPVSSGGVYAALSGKQASIRAEELHLSDTWSGNGPFTQSVTLEGITSRSKVDIQPDAEYSLLRDARERTDDHIFHEVDRNDQCESEYFRMYIQKPYRRKTQVRRRTGADFRSRRNGHRKTP